MTSQMWMLEWRSDGEREGGWGGREKLIRNLIRLSKVYIPCNDKVIVSFPDKKCVGTYFGSV